MNEDSYITLKMEIYEDMVFRYFKAQDKILELEIELFELQEELDILKRNNFETL